MRTEKNSPLSSNLCPIINTLEHLVVVLGNWAETPFFLQLQFNKNTVHCAREGAASVEDLDGISPSSEPQIGTIVETADAVDMAGTVFEESIEELKYLRENLIQEVVDSIFYSISARSFKYRTEVSNSLTFNNYRRRSM